MVDIKKRLQQNEIKGGSKNSTNISAGRGKILTTEKFEEGVKNLSPSRQVRIKEQK